LLYVLFLFRVVHAPTFDLEAYLCVNLFGRGWLFLAGTMAAWLWRLHGAALRERLRQVRWLVFGGADLILLLPVMALDLLLQWVAQRGFWAAEAPPHHAWHVVEAALWGSILFLLLVLPLRSRRVLVNPALRGVGVVSYSLFLVHIPVAFLVFHEVRTRMPGFLTSWNAETLLICAALLLACLALATLGYWTVERPFLVRKARLRR
jgi:peptidoglycan/LPS O-acetylase OafA/YrhL